MSTIAASSLRARFRRLARRWTASDEGVAAVEFGLIVPIMAVMFIGAVELSQAITVDRRVTQVASSTADLVARFSPAPNGANGISQTEITDIMKVGGYIMAPYSANPLKIVLRGVSSSPTSATNTKQAWILHLYRRGQLAQLLLHQHVVLVAGQPGHDAGQRRHLGSDLQLQAAGVRLLHEVDGQRAAVLPAPTS